MPPPASRQALLDAIATTHAALQRELDGVPEGRARASELEGHAKGDTMSVCDLTAYLVGWTGLMLKWHAARAEGRAADLPDTGFGWNELGRLARRFYAEGADLALSELRLRLCRNQELLLAVVADQDERALFTVPWYGKYPLGRMIHFNSSAPFANARTRLRRWKRRAGLPLAR